MGRNYLGKQGKEKDQRVFLFRFFLPSLKVLRKFRSLSLMSCCCLSVCICWPACLFECIYLVTPDERYIRSVIFVCIQYSCVFEEVSLFFLLIVVFKVDGGKRKRGVVVVSRDHCLRVVLSLRCSCVGDACGSEAEITQPR